MQKRRNEKHAPAEKNQRCVCPVQNPLSHIKRCRRTAATNPAISVFNDLCYCSRRTVSHSHPPAAHNSCCSFCCPMPLNRFPEREQLKRCAEKSGGWIGKNVLSRRDSVVRPLGRTKKVKIGFRPFHLQYQSAFRHLDYSFVTSAQKESSDDCDDARGRIVICVNAFLFWETVSNASTDQAVVGDNFHRFLHSVAK